MEDSYMATMNPFSEVFYKTDESPGWKVAILFGDEECVTSKAKKLWKTFKVFSGNNSLPFLSILNKLVCILHCHKLTSSYNSPFFL